MKKYTPFQNLFFLLLLTSSLNGFDGFKKNLQKAVSIHYRYPKFDKALPKPLPEIHHPLLDLSNEMQSRILSYVPSLSNKEKLCNIREEYGLEVDSGVGCFDPLFHNAQFTIKVHKFDKGNEEEMDDLADIHITGRSIVLFPDHTTIAYTSLERGTEVETLENNDQLYLKVYLLKQYGFPQLLKEFKIVNERILKEFKVINEIFVAERVPVVEVLRLNKQGNVLGIKIPKFFIEHIPEEYEVKNYIKKVELEKSKTFSLIEQVLEHRSESEKSILFDWVKGYSDKKIALKSVDVLVNTDIYVEILWFEPLKEIQTFGDFFRTNKVIAQAIVKDKTIESID